MNKQIVVILLFGIVMLSFTVILGVFSKDSIEMGAGSLGLIVGIPVLYGEVMPKKQKLGEVE